MICYLNNTQLLVMALKEACLRRKGQLEPIVICGDQLDCLTRTDARRSRRDLDRVAANIEAFSAVASVRILEAEQTSSFTKRLSLEVRFVGTPEKYLCGRYFARKRLSKEDQLALTGLKEHVPLLERKITHLPIKKAS